MTLLPKLKNLYIKICFGLDDIPEENIDGPKYIYSHG